MLISLLVVGIIIVGAALTFQRAFVFERTQAVSLNKKAAADLYAAELLDFFRSLPSAAVLAYLRSLPPYPFCAHINILDRSSGSLVNPDPTATLPAVTALGELTGPPSVRPNRFYQIQVLDLSTQQLDSQFCSLTAAQVALWNQIVSAGQTALTATERLYITVGVTWGVPDGGSTPAPNRTTLTTLLLQ